jgi:alpha-amylase
MGTPEQLRNMINICRKNNVRVYADAVVNHMAGNGNDVFPSHCSGSVYWGAKNSSGGSPFYSQGYAYENWKFTGSRPGMEMPAVPYGPNDFHCARSLNSWTDGFILNYGWLVNLADLNTETDYVRQRIADYFTDLLSLGFSGFRIDAAKHISPTNLAAIFAKLKSNLGGSLPDDFITYLEVIIGGEKDLLMCQDNSYNFGQSFANFMRQAGLSDSEINKVKIWESDYPKEFPLCGWPIPSERYAIQLDCHDDQFPGSSSRDMGDSGSVLVKEKNVEKHRNFEIQMLTRTDGNWKIKLVLSSYTFIESRGAYSFPDGNSDCSRCQSPECRQKCTKSMPYSQASREDVCGYTCV